MQLCICTAVGQRRSEIMKVTAAFIADKRWERFSKIIRDVS